MKSKDSNYDYEYINVTKYPKSYRTVRDFTFLKYIRVVMKWGCSYSGLQRSELELLLYIYAEGRFKKSIFGEYRRVTNITTPISFPKMQKEGWIQLWSKRGGVNDDIYTTTNKAKALCSRIHKMLLGEEDLPETTRSNPLLTKSDTTYLDLIKKMNRENKKERDDT